ncbi:MAG: MBL fold metallo-hydrolase [Alistipes timonensis]|nr:MBL fold metallo-hydrolase [Alistipes timonensis]
MSAARYKKTTSDSSLFPGLFDDVEDAGFFHPGDRAQGLPDIEREVERLRREGIFNNGADDLTPMEDVKPADKLTFISFGSGSSGNCAYIGDSSTGLLIDAGVDANTVTDELRRYGIKMDHIKGILLTHDHSDHVRYVYTLVRKRPHIGVYCTPKVLNGILRRHSISNRIKDYHRPIYKEHPFRIGSFEATAFEVLHDGTDNAGFFITRGRHSMAVATDLGKISERADHYMRQANYLMIEANYDSAMLAAGSYPEYLKARIRSDNGHLDNAVTAEYLARIYTAKLKNIFLCHLSRDNNRPDIAYAAVEKALAAVGVRVGNCSNTPYDRSAPLQLMALPRFDSSGLITLSL